jgi:hypothetical protein
VTAARALGWALFALWATWCCALQGALGHGAAWMPDLGLVFALSLLAHLEAADAPVAALLATLARASVGVEPPVPVLAGFLLVFALALAVRSVVELSNPVWRAANAAGLVLAFQGWLALVHEVRLRADGVDGAGFDPLAPLPAALTSGLLALAAGPLLARLPGLTPLRRRRW